VKLKKKQAKCTLGEQLCGTFRKVDRKYLGRFEIWCWRRMENISWTDLMRNDEVFQSAKLERNILQTIRRRKASWTGHILSRKRILKHVIGGKIEEG